MVSLMSMHEQEYEHKQWCFSLLFYSVFYRCVSCEHCSHLHSKSFQNRSWTQKVSISHHQRSFHCRNRKKKIQAQWAKTQRMVQWWRRKVKFIFFSSSWNIRSFNPFFFMLLNSWTSCSDGNWSKLGRVCGLFTLAEWVSSVCKEPWLLMSPTFLCRHLRSPECFTSRFKAKNDGADGD